MNVDRLIEVLAADKAFGGTDEHLTATEIANILWLARQIQLDPSPVAEDDIKEPVVGDVKVGGTIDVLDVEPPPEPEPTPNPSPDPTIEIATPPPAVGVLPQKALPIWVSDAPLLGDSLGLMRSLRPLLRKVPSQVAHRLDEAETVDRIARTDIWSPVLKPELEPWFDVALVVDSSVSMNLWQRLADDLELALKHYGAFRDLRTWNLEVEGGTVKLHSRIASARTRRTKPSGDRSPTPTQPEADNPNATPDVESKSQPHLERPARNPRELVAADGRRIVIVLSDCVADYWWDGLMWPVLEEWGQAMPTTIWQMLPEWMWARTALSTGESVAVRNRVPGGTNERLESELLSLLAAELSEESESPKPAIALPVMTSEQTDIAAWSRMLAGDRRQVLAGISIPQHVEVFGDFPESAENGEGEIQATEIIQQFRMLSSPRARQLAALLAAAPVITLPVMRLIRKSMLPEGSPLPVAEVFLSGLLRRLPEQSRDTESELVQYDFVSGVREALLDMLPQVDAIEVINAVSRQVSQQLGYSSLKQFKAFLLSPEAERSEDLRGLRAFATVTATILKLLGGEYARMAREFEPPDTPLPGSETPDFPELEDYEYETATIFAIVEPFEFETARIASKAVERRTGFLRLGRKEVVRQLNIQPSRGAAWQFVESLGSGIELEMVSIPGGSFIMGSPEDEPKNRSNEKPQHEVTVPSFYLGKYPVTQAQWRAVAALPQVERELNPDPSDFKGETL
ncbi:MAG: formylglycine-generating enzyme family protein, partial [Cyanobacteriota bacterium]|nr:formylglycine-generating enzyme family protein [Cyanobacteriota bacterium]